ncbi:MAG: hypothetical protein MJ181_10150 [Treponema sp.]|nr:hypothetical protein [Treponema sp.]
MSVPEIFKGYVCPNECENCIYKKTDCIVFSEKGKKIAKEWEKLEREQKQKKYECIQKK